MKITAELNLVSVLRLIKESLYSYFFLFKQLNDRNEQQILRKESLPQQYNWWIYFESESTWFKRMFSPNAKFNYELSTDNLYHAECKNTTLSFSAKTFQFIALPTQSKSNSTLTEN